MGPLARPALANLEATQFMGKFATRFGYEAALGPAAVILGQWGISPDGNYHLVVVGARKTVAGAETGGALALDLYEGGNFVSRFPLFTGGQPAGPAMASAVILAKGVAGASLALTQTTPLTAGASTAAISVFSFK